MDKRIWRLSLLCHYCFLLIVICIPFFVLSFFRFACNAKSFAIVFPFAFVCNAKCFAIAFLFLLYFVCVFRRNWLNVFSMLYLLLPYAHVTSILGHSGQKLCKKCSLNFHSRHVWIWKQLSDLWFCWLNSCVLTVSLNWVAFQKIFLISFYNNLYVYIVIYISYLCYNGLLWTS